MSFAPSWDAMLRALATELARDDDQAFDDLPLHQQEADVGFCEWFAGIARRAGYVLVPLVTADTMLQPEMWPQPPDEPAEAEEIAT